ncbi:MAG: DUF2760 domain-containing protein [Rhodospirillales bacterium]|nr:DUF2760 domain-containing protein [Rhodospirillales bacterium]
MKVVVILAAVVVLVLSALAFVPDASVYQPYVSYGTVAVAGLLLLLVLLDRGTKATPPAPVAVAAKPAPVPPAPNQAEAEIVSFLATLQEKGRLIDFLMDDVTAYADAQVGAAARVVHEGCRSALREHFGIRPIRDENEGAKVSIPVGYPADEYRLVGKISGEAPFTGILVHRGWRTEWVKLPRVLRSGGDRLPTIAPAEVEIT